MERYPVIWQSAGSELVATLEDGRSQTLNDHAAKARAAEELWHLKIRQSRHNPKVIESAIPHLVKSRMSALAMNQCYHAAATGRDSGKIRFNRWNASIIQRLLFHQGLVRKPVSMQSFRFWWRFVSQKRILMPLVQRKGIYCFYSRELIGALSALIGTRPCLEIGAGDGTLTQFLADEGIQIRATDNFSWSHAIEYPAAVEKIAAKQALDKYQPQAVICSWPPAGNSFEQRVLSARSVEIYLVIGSRYRFASGNWDSYESQNRFDWSIDSKLSALVLPPELESAVLVFRRKGKHSFEETAIQGSIGRI